MRRISALVAVCLIGICTIAVGADLPAAAEVRKKIEAAPTHQPATNPSAAPMRAKIDELAKKIAAMPAADAAGVWLGLFDEYSKASHAAPGAVSFAELLKALPPPSAWEELSKAVAARKADGDDANLREQALRLFASVLTSSANQEDAKALAKLLSKDQAREDQARSLVTALAVQQPGDLVKSFETQIAEWTVMGGVAPLTVPDLVTLVGAEKAEALLHKAAVLPGAVLNLSIGAETAKLTRKVALAEIEKLSAPQWALCNNLSPESVALFEAMEKKFVKKDPNAAEGADAGVLNFGGNRMRAQDDYAYRTASAYYLLGLIVAGRTDDAIAQAKRMPATEVDISYGALNELDEAGHTQTVQAFLHRALAENPDLPMWDSYVSLSAKTGKTAQMLELARKSAARANLDKARETQIRRQLAKALLAADEPDEGISVLQQNIERALKAKEDAFDSVLLLARVGRLLKREALINEAIGDGKKMLEQRAAQSPLYNDYSSREYTKQLAAFMEQVGRAPEAVEMLADALASAKPPADENQSGDGERRELAIELVGIYHRAGRHADVLELLQTLPMWGANDLAEIYTAQESHETPLGFVAAAALADAGKKDDARRVLNAVLDASGGFDPAYELLIKLDGEGAIARLNEIFARDQFEERPLIWKGALLVQQNKIPDAEKVIRQAIAIDPSDGEQGKGTRMRVYSVLADILDKKGDAEQAKVFRGAVKAIRTAEDADDWWEAGLLTAAIKQYEQALTYFQDAYCIQSRLALRMAEMGFTEKAEEHYRKAYELMPDSFGRMESHCFGCEGAFRGSTARKIAEEVFNKLIKKTPDKPQVHYLLGYLREQQGDYAKALEPMQSAVKLDPDYLNAWKHIADLAGRMYLSPDVRDAAVLNLLRLDPLGRHVNPDVSNVRDMRKLWEASARVSGVRKAPPQSLLALPASKKPVDPNEHAEFLIPPHDEQAVTSPGEMLGRTQVVQAIGQILDSH